MSVQDNSGSSNLVEVLEKVLDKGIVIAGDIKINLADIELLTIKIRLMVASVDKAKEIGMDWWETDPYFSSKAVEAAPSQSSANQIEAPDQERLQLENKISELEQELSALKKGTGE